MRREVAFVVNASIIAASLAVPTFFVPKMAQACSGCGCTLDVDDLSSDATASGLQIDERVDYINQSGLFLGGRTAPPQDPSQVEVQKKTITVFYTTTIDYGSLDGWGINVAVPFQYRDHTTLNNGDYEQSTSLWNGISDVRIIGRYNGFTESRDYGVLFGIKLPTGSTTEKFRGATVGQVVDRGLQPGTGSYDLLLGLAQSGEIGGKLGWFAQELWQKPLDGHNQFRQGQTLNATIGVRYAISEMFSPQLQFNGQNRWRDTGLMSDRINSGGETIYASPGLIVHLTDTVSTYGFVQIPIYQRVGGLELVPDYTASVGVKLKF